MPRRYPPEIRRQVVELARSGTKVAQLVATFGMSEATIYNWLKQEQIDRGEISESISRRVISEPLGSCLRVSRGRAGLRQGA